jgi:hypothetical protein
MIYRQSGGTIAFAIGLTQVPLAQVRYAGVSRYRPRCNQFADKYTGFTQAGVYRIIIHAEDNEGLAARPVVLEAMWEIEFFYQWWGGKN